MSERQNIRTSLAVLVAFFLPIFESGCASLTMDPHENFKAKLYSSIGQNINNIPPYRIPHEKDLLDVKNMQNGNIEKAYKYIRSCRYFFEINPTTNIVVGARFDGLDTDCISTP